MVGCQAGGAADASVVTVPRVVYRHDRPQCPELVRPTFSASEPADVPGEPRWARRLQELSLENPDIEMGGQPLGVVGVTGTGILFRICAGETPLDPYVTAIPTGVRPWGLYGPGEGIDFAHQRAARPLIAGPSIVCPRIGGDQIGTSPPKAGTTTKTSRLSTSEPARPRTTISARKTCAVSVPIWKSLLKSTRK